MLAGAVTLAAVVRHRLLRRQLAPHLPEAGHVVDLGCGAGWLAVDLVREGYHVTALDADAAMVDTVRRRRDQLTTAEAGRLEIVAGRVEDVSDLLPSGGVDVVCCHAVLPVVRDHHAVLATIVGLVRPGGVVSVVAKNAAALPVRAALEGRFEEALALAGGADERDEHGRILRAHQPEDVIAVIDAAGATVEAWYGLQVATAQQLDVVAPDVVAPAVDLEWRLGRTDPLRRVARMFHVIARRSTGPAGGW